CAAAYCSGGVCYPLAAGYFDIW
nr:immunoglobulin heavy chain junction region [Macaca mulatta]